MSTAKCVGRVGALAVALGVGIAIAITPGAALAEPADSGMSSSPDRTALIMGGTTIPTPDDYMVQLFKNQIIAPTHPGEDIDYVALTTPQEWWPVTGFARLIGLVAGPPSVWGPGGAGWPDEPLWKLSGLFDLTIGQSLQAGVVDLETAMAAHGNDHLVVFGVSQGGICGRWSRVHAATHRDLADRYRAMATSLDFEGCNRGNSALAICVVGPHPSGVDSRRQYPAC